MSTDKNHDAGSSQPAKCRKQSKLPTLDSHPLSALEGMALKRAEWERSRKEIERLNAEYRIRLAAERKAQSKL